MCRRLVQEQELTIVQSWDMRKTAYELRKAWSLRGLRSTMRDGAKGRASRSIFQTETSGTKEPTYDGQRHGLCMIYVKLINIT